MRGEQAIFNVEIKKKSGLSINPDVHHSKVFSSGHLNWIKNMEDSVVFNFNIFSIVSSSQSSHK